MTCIRLAPNIIVCVNDDGGMHMHSIYAGYGPMSRRMPTRMPSKLRCGFESVVRIFAKDEA